MLAYAEESVLSGRFAYLGGELLSPIGHFPRSMFYNAKEANFCVAHPLAM